MIHRYEETTEREGADMSILVVDGVSKSYSEKILFNQVSLAINEGQKIGLIGINGTGKSTFLKVIAGLETPDEGKVTLNGKIKIEYLFQSPHFEEGTTVLEQVFKGSSPVMKLLREYEKTLEEVTAQADNESLQKRLIGLSLKMDQMEAWSIETEAKRILTKLGIVDFKSSVDKLSGGQRKRVAMASILITPSDLLILDEPTNHIDNETVDWLEKLLNNRKGALLMVTHDRYLLDRVCNRMIELDNGKLYGYQANYTKYLEMKLEREEILEASERKRQNLIRTELAWIRRGARARSTKQKARIDRFESLTNQQGPTDNMNVDIEVGFSRLGRKIIEIEDVTKTYSGISYIKDFSYVLLRDDRIGIIGPNGCGKSTLMKMASGMLQPDQGQVVIGKTVKIGYFSQENDEMDESLRVIDYIKEQAEFIATESGSITASQMLEKFLFSPNEQWTLISKLSGGERRRLYLLKILMQAPNILMLDEPTNDLDIQTLTVLEGYLEDFPGAVIAVSHDRYFLDRVVDHIFSFDRLGVINQYPGNYSDYSGKISRRQLLEETVESTKKENKVSEKRNNQKKKMLKFSYNEQKEFDQIDSVIETLENKIQSIEAKMIVLASDFEQLQNLSIEKDNLEKELDHAIARWTYLNDLFEEIEKNKNSDK